MVSALTRKYRVMRCREIIYTFMEIGEEFTSRDVSDCWNRTKMLPNDKRRKLRPTERECCKIVSGFQDLERERRKGDSCNTYWRDKNFKYNEADLMEIINGTESELIKRA